MILIIDIFSIKRKVRSAIVDYKYMMNIHEYFYC